MTFKPFDKENIFYATLALKREQSIIQPKHCTIKGKLIIHINVIMVNSNNKNKNNSDKYTYLSYRYCRCL